MLLPKKLLVLENETPLRKQEKLPPERESVQLVKNLEEKLQGDLLEGEDARTSSFFILFWYELFIWMMIFHNMWKLVYVPYQDTILTFNGQQR